MGYASFLVWKDGGGWIGSARMPLLIYFAQLFLDMAWYVIFLKAQKLDLVGRNI